MKTTNFSFIKQISLSNFSDLFLKLTDNVSRENHLVVCLCNSKNHPTQKGSF